MYFTPAQTRRTVLSTHPNAHLLAVDTAETSSLQLVASQRIPSDPGDLPHLNWVERPVLTVPEVAKLLRIGRTAAYEAVRRGELPVINIGRRVLVPVPALLGILGATPPMALPSGGQSGAAAAA